LTIGQSPRPDLIAPLRRLLPAGCRLMQAGALDNLPAEEIPPPGQAGYPLQTRLRDGSPVLVQESFLLPRLQEALTILEARGAAASILLCAGTFAGLRGERPFIKPFDIARAQLQASDLHTLGLITPVREQEAPIRQRWQAAGFQTTVWTGDVGAQDDAFWRQLEAQIATHNLECILLDYVGHPPQQVEALAHHSPRPVFDLGQMAMHALLHLLRQEKQ
jgi:protein AroM